ncbi:hypothetical protein [Haliea sp. E17]|uniref:hypothetical protein n=1 Tax=Haliea sp. E17 TaxID=3401576 RepID=UPI003AAEDB70
MNKNISRISGVIIGACLSASGCFIFFDSADILSSQDTGMSGHFAGITGIIGGTIIAIYGIGVAVASIVATAAMERWVSNEHKDVNLW